MNCRSKFLMNAEVWVFCVCVYTSVYTWRWMCDNWRAEGHLGPLHNNYVSTGDTHTHTDSERPLVIHAWPVHNALLRFHSPLARQQNYREKDLERQDLPRLWEQPDSFLHHKKIEEEQLQLSHSQYIHPGRWKYCITFLLWARCTNENIFALGLHAKHLHVKNCLKWRHRG